MLNKTDNRSIHTHLPVSEKVDANAEWSWLDPISDLAEASLHYDVHPQLTRKRVDISLTAAWRVSTS
jgi:hypothetical protein